MTHTTRNPGTICEAAPEYRILDDLDDGYLLVSEDCKVTWANATFRRITGSPADDPGQAVHSLGGDGDLATRILAAPGDGDEIPGFECRLRNPAGWEHLCICSGRRAPSGRGWLLRFQIAPGAGDCEKIIEYTGAATILIEGDSTISAANTEFEHLSGYSRSEIVGIKQLIDFIAYKDERRRLIGYHAIRRRDPAAAPRNYSFSFIDRYGEIHIVDVTIGMIPGVNRSMMSLIDVTARRRVEEALQKSEEQLNLAFKAADDGLIDWDLATGTIFCSPRCFTMLGYEPEKSVLATPSLSSLVHPDDRGRLKEGVAGMATGGCDRLNIEFRVRSASGKWIYLLSRLQVVSRDADGMPLRIAGTHSDITERKKAERDLLIRDMAMESSLSAIGIADLNGYLTYANRALADMRGLTDPRDLLGRHVSELWVDPEKIRGVLRTLADQDKFTGELVGRRSDGTEFVAHVTVNFVTGQAGEPVCIMATATDITGKRRMEEALRESEERYRTLVESAPDAIFLLSRDGDILYLSSAGGRLFGVDPETLQGRNIRELFPPDIVEKWLETIQGVADSRTGPVTGETLLPEEYGNTWLETRLIPMMEGEGFVKSVLGISRDITGWKRAEEQLRLQAQVLRQVDDAVIAVDLEGRITYLNLAAERLYGVPSSEAPGKPSTEVFTYEWLHPDDKEEVWLALRDTGIWHGVTIHRKLDGEAIFVDATLSVLEGDHGEVAGVLCSFRDITEQRRAEIELRIKDMAIASSLSSIILVNLDGRIIYANRAFHAMAGWEQEKDVVGTTVSALWADPEEEKQVWEEILRSGAWYGETMNRRRDGTVFPIQLAISTVTDESGRALCLMGSGIDISQRKEAEQDLRIKDMAMESSLSGIVLTDLDGRIIYVNQATLAMNRWEHKEDIIGESISVLWADLEERERVREEVFRSGAWYGEVMNRRRDGTTFPLQLALSTVTDESGRALCLMGSGIDISQQKEIEKDLRVHDMAVASSLTAFTISDLGGRLIYVNQAFLSLWGYDSDTEVLGRSATILWQDEEDAANVIQEIIDSGRYIRERIGRRRDGTKICVRFSGNMVRDDAGAPICLTASIADITDLKRTKEDIRARNRELSILNQIISELTSAVDIDEALKGVLATTISLLDLAGGGIYLVKLDQQSARLVCVQNLPEDFPGHAYIPDITMPPYADVFVDGNAIFTCDREEGDLPPHATIPIVAPGGVIGSLNLIPHGRKEFTGNDRPLLVAIGRGIGRSLERTLLIQQLEKAQREANLYLDILSHDIRNAENISGLYTDLLIDALEGEAKGYAQRIRNSIRKSIEILRNVSTIRRIHHESATLAPIDLDEVIQGEIGIFSEITFHYEGTDLAVMADPLLTEVFTNLIGNAVKFGGAAVEVTIRVEKSGDDVLVSVEDTGPGVPDEMKEVVFMRFRKNMSHKSGQGIGLYITRMLIERYGGRIRVDDRVPGHPEGGAAFRFTLKRA